jgi:NADH-ubiquinone oxidoreductase chain 1
MTEHAAVIFVFFFLAEYASIVLICVLISILFFGGYLYNIIDLASLLEYYSGQGFVSFVYNVRNIIQFSIEGLISGILLGIKSCIMVFVFI